MTRPRAMRLPIAVILVLLAAAATARPQQARLTERAPPSPAPDPAATTTGAPLPPATSPFADTAGNATPAASPRHEIGDTTRALLRMQAEGTYAGRSLPILGDQASRSYQRYIDSFEHPIPERFEQAVPGSRTP